MFDDPVDPLATPTPSRNQLRLWRERIESEHLPAFLRDRVLPQITSVAEATLDSPRRPTLTFAEDDHAKVLVTYPSVVIRDAYLRESVLLEFGGRMTIEPIELLPIQTYLQDELPDLASAYELPTATPQVVHGARTFWEKVTAVHAFVTRDDAASRFAKADRLSRHWSDLVALRSGSLGDIAVERPDLRDAVIRLKTLFFPAAGVDYTACNTGKIRLMPNEPLLGALRHDYEAMQEQGMFRSDDPPPSFPELLDLLQVLERELNAMASPMDAPSH